jgi:hypothetical protein
MSDQVSIKEFKSIIKSAIEEELEEIGESTSNTVKTGYFFAQWVHNLIEEYDGGYAEYAEIPEVKDKGVDFVLVDRQKKMLWVFGQYMNCLWKKAVGILKTQQSKQFKCLKNIQVG